MGLPEERERQVDLVRTHLVETFTAQNDNDPDGTVERCGETIAKLLNAGPLLLVDVIDQFGEKLTSADVQDRAKAVDILHYMFTFLKPATLSTNDLTYLVEFLVDRLRDQHLVIPKVILCLQPIVKYEHLPPGSCSKILNRLFMEVNMQSHVHRIRRSYFITVQHMLRVKAHLLDLQANMPNFLEHFIDSFAGEKDPRNLIILFNIVPTVLKNFPISPLEEELFESLACYFPIDFNPVTRVNSADMITREDLTSALQFCLSRTNLFSKFLIPLALEKLASDLVNAKLDSLNLLTMCCDECYGPDDLSPLLKDIWHALRREVFLAPNEQIEPACFPFIRSVFKALSKDPDILRQSIEMIFSECRHHLSEPELRLSLPASKVLLAITESNEASCSGTFGLVVSLLHQQFLENTINSNRKAILGILQKSIGTLSAFPTLSLGDMLPNWDEIVGTWFTLLSHSDPEFMMLGLSLFRQLFDNKISHMRMQVGQNETDVGLDSSYRNLLQEHLFTLICKAGVPKDLASCAILVTERFAFTFPDEVASLLIPRFLNVFDNNASTGAGTGHHAELNSTILHAISECSVIPAIGYVTLPRLTDLATQEHKDTQITNCLANAVANICMTESKELIRFICESLNGIERFVKAGTVFAQRGSHETCAILAEIVTKLIRAVGQPMQQTLVDRIWNVSQNQPSGGPTILQHIPILLLEALLAPLHSHVHVQNKMQLIETLLDEITSRGRRTVLEVQTTGEDQGDTTPGPVSAAYVRLFAVLHNKMEDTDFEEILTRVQGVIQNAGLFEQLDSSQATEGPGVGIETESKTQSQMLETEDKAEGATVDTSDCLNLLIWTTKSLVMKGSPHLDKWIDSLITLLRTERHGPSAAEGFSTILSDRNSSLVPENNCKIKFLYKQRFFMMSVPKLIAAYRECSAPSATRHKMNYIKALSCQLKYVPNSVMHTQLENVIPLLIAGLCLSEPESGGPGPVSSSSVDQLVVLSSLNAIFELFTTQQNSSSSDANPAGNESSSTSLVQYFRDLAPRLLELSSFKENMEIRKVSLRCLQRCAKFPTHVIVPLKNKIVSELGKSLDDSKRLVRKEAVLTRNIWILSGAPGGI